MERGQRSESRGMGFGIPGLADASASDAGVNGGLGPGWRTAASAECGGACESPWIPGWPGRRDDDTEPRPPWVLGAWRCGLTSWLLRKAAGRTRGGLCAGSLRHGSSNLGRAVVWWLLGCAG